MIGEKQHAVLSPSAAHRWLKCTPSARLEEQFPDTTSEAAEEGTVAHALAELLLRREKKEIPTVKFKRELKTIKDSEYYNASMQEYVEGYVTYCLEKFAEAKTKTVDAAYEIEVKLDLREFIPEGFGTGDFIIIADSILNIIDLKYGRGVQVDAEENDQMKIYALGALSRYGYIYKIDKVRMHIYQPRIDNFSVWEQSVPQLEQWKETVLVPTAKKAFAGSGEYVTGDHCQFCRAKAVCKAYAKKQLEIAKYEFRQADLLDEKEVADILDREKDLMSWLKAVKDYSLDQAVNHDTRYPGYKLVEGRSNRVFTEEDKVVKELKAMDIKEEDIYTTKMNGITHFEKLLGRSVFRDHLGPFIVKPKGKPTLVPDYDKRPEIGSAGNAVEDFKNVKI